MGIYKKETLSDQPVPAGGISGDYGGFVCVCSADGDPSRRQIHSAGFASGSERAGGSNGNPDHADLRRGRQVCQRY